MRYHPIYIPKEIKSIKDIKLSDLISQIPSDCIFNKNIAGIGATYLEIMNRLRNSIIIVPYVPVINGKVKFHKQSQKIRGVTDKVDVKMIVNYLKNDNIYPKKLMTTPESFYKIISAMDLLGIDIYNDYFLMFDECDRITADVDFRSSMINPMNEFFKFKNKAFVSATALKPSDPRFRDFTFYELVPKCNYSQPLKLIATNNPPEVLKAEIEKIFADDSCAQIFVFFNTIHGILTFIEKNNLAEDSAVFCSKINADRIKSKTGLQLNMYDNIEEKSLKRINFLTSRFYTAVDIFADSSPHVFILSDPRWFPHTMVDLYRDVAQIGGRIRNFVLKSFTFISSHTKRNFYRSEEDAREYLRLNKFAFKQIRDMKTTSIFEENKQLIDDILRRTPYATFMLNEHQQNYFMIDNYLLKNLVTSFYTTSNNWFREFQSAELKRSFDVTFFISNAAKLSHYPRNLNLDSHSNIVEKVIEHIKNANETGNETEKLEMLTDLEQNYPVIYEGYKTLGEKRLLRCKKTEKSILKELLLYRQEKGIYENFDFLNELELTFTVGQFYPEDKLKSIIEDLIDKYDLCKVSQHIKFLKRFYKLKRTTKRLKVSESKKAGYLISEKIL
ncbi:hypothetical protein ACR78Z_12195 [Sphingobacterium thalpophilum]|uniref:hypothetical protein n=1 Tax=Sphingobacterium thalpophilum TaxID=259 RepID=UPI003DA6C4B6